MYFNKCPECGAYLDPGEKCECAKKGRPRGNGDGLPKCVSSVQLEHNSILPRKKANVNNTLHNLRVKRHIPAAVMVEVVRQLYPKFDKTLQSKCERDEYGIDIKPKAMDALLEKFSPDLLEEEKRRREGGHRLQCRVLCRLENDVYAKLTKYVSEDGFATMQSWLTSVITNYIKDKETNNV